MPLSQQIHLQPLSAARVSAHDFAEFVARPENGDRSFELIHGEIVELPPPKKPHGVVCANLTAILHAYSRASGRGYVTSNDTGYITERDPDSVRGPDVAYWDDSEATTKHDPEYTHTPPLLAVESSRRTIESTLSL